MQPTDTIERVELSKDRRVELSKDRRVGPALGSGLRARLPWLLLVLALAAAGAFAYLWQTAAGSAQAESELRAEARRFVLALTNFGSETIEDDVDEIRSFASGPFADEVDELFGNATIAAIRKAEAASTGRVEEIFVQEMDGGSASVFAVVRGEVANKNIAEPRTDVVRMEVGLVRSGERWKVERVELFQSPTTS